MTEEVKNEPVEIIGMVQAHYVKVDEPEPGFLIQLKGEASTMSAFMTDEAMVRLMEWVSTTLKERLDKAIEDAAEVKKATVTH